MDMNQINYTEKDENFSSNIHSYDKKSQARKAIEEFKINLLNLLGDILGIVKCIGVTMLGSVAISGIIVIMLLLVCSV